MFTWIFNWIKNTLRNKQKSSAHISSKTLIFSSSDTKEDSKTEDFFYKPDWVDTKPEDIRARVRKVFDKSQVPFFYSLDEFCADFYQVENIRIKIFSEYENIHAREYRFERKRVKNFTLERLFYNRIRPALKKDFTYEVQFLFQKPFVYFDDKTEQSYNFYGISLSLSKSLKVKLVHFIGDIFVVNKEQFKQIASVIYFYDSLESLKKSGYL